MAIQTTMNYRHDQTFVGTEYGVGLSEVVTGISDEVIEFGWGVVYDATIPEFAGRKNVNRPSGASDKFVGIALFKHSEASGTRNTALTSGGEVSNYKAKETISILEQGKVWVKVEQAVAPGDAVYLRYTANGALVPGNFRKDGDTSKAFQLTKAEWVTSTTGAGQAVLHIYK